MEKHNRFSLVEARQLDFRMTRLEWTDETATQETCRSRRYTFFQEVMRETGRDQLVLAHHRDDQLETFHPFNCSAGKRISTGFQ